MTLFQLRTWTLRRRVTALIATVALVLGEFTIASLLNRDNLQVAINQLGKSSATMSVAVYPSGWPTWSPSPLG